MTWHTDNLDAWKPKTSTFCSFFVLWSFTRSACLLGRLTLIPVCYFFHLQFQVLRAVSLFSFICRPIRVEAAQTFSVLLKNAYILKPDTLRLAALDGGRRGLCDRGRPAALALNTPTVLQGKGAGKAEAWENTEASKQQPVTQTAARTLQYCPHTVTMHKGGKVPVVWMLLSSTYCKNKSAVIVQAVARSLPHEASWRN